MINNYLDYVKSQRKDALKAARHSRDLRRIDQTDWGTGFYDGHTQARIFESRHWRTLQKDIEAAIKQSEGYYPEDAGFIILNKFES